jgi:uncharacterized protein with GYD domain
MARYLFQASYTSEAWASQVNNPQNRVEMIRPVIERLGGRLESASLSFGDYDVVVIAERLCRNFHLQSLERPDLAPRQLLWSEIV